MRTGWLWPAMAAVAVLALASGCGGAGSRPAETVAVATPSLALTAAQATLAPSEPILGGQRYGDLLVWLSSRPSQPVQGTAQMEAYLVGTEGQPVTDAKVSFDTDMTNMSHGLNLVTAELAGNGHYSGNVHFSMPGPWRVIAVIERPSRETVKLRFEFKVNAR